ncbi:NAD(P)-dependent oxidoreductase [Parasphingopyxis algicola]|uniref:NAD(P)-dependent oxidoreductase n=1 Tax=Parasphingopyxis algicola TaxID=2026624 RepID=UPI0015A02CE8|nr:NAD(P)-binding domain-containing protein [Parasphingopyxis algicola]QLC24926.1 NAD(P)-dependent oxidoreductase [Parasphingopyxis algicola]
MKLGLLGLGNMGAALAKAFTKKGHEVVGWSRSEATRKIAASFCDVRDTVDAVVTATDLIIVCLPDYGSTVAACDAVEKSAWAGKTFVQLSSGSPEDARATDRWAKERQLSFIDGAIATFPDRIGAPTTAIFFSGDRTAYDACDTVLKALGGRNVFVSDAVTGAAALDLAWLSLYYGVSLGLLHGAAFCETEGVKPVAFFAAMPSFIPEIEHAAREYDEMIARDDYRGDQAALAVHVAAMEHLASSAERTGLDTRFTDLLLSLYGEAVQKGDGEMEIAAGIKVIRNTR